MPICRPKAKDAVPLTQVLDENFDCLLRVARSMCGTLARPKDQAICHTTLGQLVKFNKSESIVVKQNVRKFLKFYLQVLRWTQKHQPVGLYEKWYGNEGNASQARAPGKQDEMHIWLEEGSSYLAMRHFEDGSTMIYSAVAKDATNGWVENGIKVLAEQSNS